MIDRSSLNSYFNRYLTLKRICNTQYRKYFVMDEIELLILGDIPEQTLPELNNEIMFAVFDDEVYAFHNMNNTCHELLNEFSDKVNAFKFNQPNCILFYHISFNVKAPNDIDIYLMAYIVKWAPIIIGDYVSPPKYADLYPIRDSTLYNNIMRVCKSITSQYIINSLHNRLELCKYYEYSFNKNGFDNRSCRLDYEDRWYSKYEPLAKLLKSEYVGKSFPEVPFVDVRNVQTNKYIKIAESICDLLITMHNK